MTMMSPFLKKEELKIRNPYKREKGFFFPEIDKKTRLGSPVARPSKIVCIGLNYAQHAKETNETLPTELIIFMKSTTSLCGPFDDVMIPKDSIKTDWEVELAVVIGNGPVMWKSPKQWIT